MTFRVTDLMIEAVPEAAGRKRKPKPKPRGPRPKEDCTVCTNCSICSVCSVCSRCSLCTQTAPPSTCSVSNNEQCTCETALDRNPTTMERNLSALRDELQQRLAGTRAA